MKFLGHLVLLCVIFPVFSLAQEKNEPTEKGKNDTIRVATTMVDDQLIPWVPLPEVMVLDRRIFKSAAEKAKYDRLKYNVMKVMPYALYARTRYVQLQSELKTSQDKKHQRFLQKTFEKEVKDMFNREIKNLTITQGGILIKLIDRETGYSSYELVKELKGGFTAFFYQSIARVVGHNLKDKYNPQEDRDIETILRSTPYYLGGY